MLNTSAPPCELYLIIVTIHLRYGRRTTKSANFWSESQPCPLSKVANDDYLFKNDALLDELLSMQFRFVNRKFWPLQVTPKVCFIHYFLNIWTARNRCLATCAIQTHYFFLKKSWYKLKTKASLLCHIFDCISYAFRLSNWHSISSIFHSSESEVTANYLYIWDDISWRHKKTLSIKHVWQ